MDRAILFQLSCAGAEHRDSMLWRGTQREFTEVKIPEKWKFENDASIIAIFASAK